MPGSSLLVRSGHLWQPEEPAGGYVHLRRSLRTQLFHQCLYFFLDLGSSLIHSLEHGLSQAEIAPREAQPSFLNFKNAKHIVSKTQNKKYQKYKIHIDNAIAVSYTLENGLCGRACVYAGIFTPYC